MRSFLSSIAFRLLSALPVFVSITIVTFLILELLPGSSAQRLLGADATPSAIHALELELGLDRPAWQRYGKWAMEFASGNWGSSLASGLPVSDLVIERLLVTLELCFVALIIAIALSMSAAICAAIRPGGLIDRTCFGLSMILISTPNYVIALLLVLLFSVTLGLLPSIGYVSPTESLAGNIRTIFLPSTALALPLAGLYARFLQEDLREQLDCKDYIVTARGKGLTSFQTVTGHALRNSVPGLITLIGAHFGTLLGGTVLVEQIFGLPGLGQLLLQATVTRDLPVIQAIVILLTIFTIVANTVADILCAHLTPLPFTKNHIN